MPHDPAGAGREPAPRLARPAAPLSPATAALLNTIAAGATATYLATYAHPSVMTADALVHGYAVATAWGAGILAAAAVIAALMITIARPASTEPGVSDRAQPEAPRAVTSAAGRVGA